MTIRDIMAPSLAMALLLPHAGAGSGQEPRAAGASRVPGLLAAESLGMIHTPEATATLRQVQKDETHGDVLLHIQIALKRKTGLDPGARRALLSMDEKMMDIAEVGQPAPDFELESPDGARIALSDYRGKKAVLVVFSYGDG